MIMGFQAFGKKWRKMKRDDLKRLGVDGCGVDWVQASSNGSVAYLRVIETKLTTDGAIWDVSI